MGSPSRRGILGVLAGLAMAASASTALADAVLVIDSRNIMPTLGRRDDVPDASYTAGASAFPNVGKFNVNGTLDSGTLISSDWVLTAAHSVYNKDLSTIHFTIGGSTYSAAQSVVNPLWTGANSDFTKGIDLALVRLSSPVAGITPAQINTAIDPIGQQGTFVGFGQSGTGTGGYGGGMGTMRVGTNMIDVNGSAVQDENGNPWSSAILVSDFDSPGPDGPNYFGSSEATALETVLGNGDSGGGLFMSKDGVNYLVGVNSFVASVTGAPDGKYGNISGQVSVLDPTNLAWIVRTAGITPVPEPGSLLMLGLGLGGLGGVAIARRRR